MQKSDWIGLIAILLMVIGGCCVSYYFIIETIHSCTSDPLKYVSDIVAEGEEYTYIELLLYGDKYDTLPFSKKEIDLKNRNYNEIPNITIKK